MTELPPPDLSDPAERAAYRSELRGVARRTRLAGLVLAALGALLALASKRAEDPAMWRLGAILAIAAGGGLIIFGSARRAMHHQLRMNVPDAGSDTDR
ncbi:MAG: hypothetical protein ACO1O3_18855 [Sphingobium sp.]